MKTGTGIALLRLLQLASPALPVGAYSYSQGLEPAIEAGIVPRRCERQRWISHVLGFPSDAWKPRFSCDCARLSCGDAAAARGWNALLLASRESAELRAESAQMCYSLARLLTELGVGDAPRAGRKSRSRRHTAYAVGAWNVPSEAALTAYLWTWAENQSCGGQNSPARPDRWAKCCSPGGADLGGCDGCRDARRRALGNSRPGCPCFRRATKRRFEALRS